MDKEAALYLHIPFCMQKCLYCDFPSFSGKEKLMEEYSLALSKEIDSNSNFKFNSIFIGGGTPTYLSLNGWKNIKKSVDELHKTKNLEFSVEGNPGTFNKDKLILFREMGVNRLSIGLQAWQNDLLKKLGRIHTIEDFLLAFEMARQMGFNNINIDLMFGLPTQSFNQWKETLERVVELSPEHISCYSLIIEEGTCFYEMENKDKLNLPGEDLERQMYEFAVDYLKQNGYFQYEISNFSKKGKECIHNIVYWETKNYIGCGSGAHSFVNNIRYSNTKSIEGYIQKMKIQGNAIEEKINNSKNDNLEEYMFMGLRMTKGISISDFQRRFGVDIYSVYGEIIKKYVNKNLIIIQEDRLYLSPAAIEISNSIMCEFILT